MQVDMQRCRFGCGIFEGRRTRDRVAINSDARRRKCGSSKMRTQFRAIEYRALKIATAAACSTAVPRLASARANLHHQLDDVDLCREVAGDLEADFLLAHGGLGPNLHFCFLLKTL
jgi:hypothetical protein